MGRRRRNKEADAFEAVMGIVGLLLLLSLLSPKLRAVFIGFSWFLLVALILAVLGLIVFAVYRWSNRSNITKNSSGNVLNAITPNTTTAQTPSPPPTSTNLIEQLRTIDWFQFEKLIELLYRKLGYSVTRKGGANPDGGIDLIIEKDGLRTAIQCKQWKTWNVGVKAVREFLGALTDSGIRSGIFITLNGYTGEAKGLAEKHGIEIINETSLVELLENDVWNSHAWTRWSPSPLRVCQTLTRGID